MDNEPRVPRRGRLSRRDLIRRGAIVGGSLLWVAPAIQSLTPAASAQTTGSPTFGCCECRTRNPGAGEGAQKCDGAGGLVCVDSTDNPTATSSAQACQQFCAGLGKSWCFHESPTLVTCAPIQQGNGLEACVGTVA
jgi:hypothetical protein